MRRAQYQIVYSPDNGHTFVLLAVNLPGNLRSITVNTHDIPKSHGSQGLIRVLIRDGLHTA